MCVECLCVWAGGLARDYHKTVVIANALSARITEGVPINNTLCMIGDHGILRTKGWRGGREFFLLFLEYDVVAPSFLVRL